MYQQGFRMLCTPFFTTYAGALSVTTSKHVLDPSLTNLILPEQQRPESARPASYAQQDSTSVSAQLQDQSTASHYSLPQAADQSGRRGNITPQLANNAASTPAAPAIQQSVAAAPVATAGRTLPDAATQRSSSGALQAQQDNKLHIPLSDLQFHELIGSSPNKALYRGSWNHTSVGVLVLRFSGVVSNARTLQRISSHPNLVQFYRYDLLCFANLLTCTCSPSRSCAGRMSGIHQQSR